MFGKWWYRIPYTHWLIENTNNTVHKVSEFNISAVYCFYGVTIVSIFRFFLLKCRWFKRISIFQNKIDDFFLSLSMFDMPPQTIDVKISNEIEKFTNIRKEKNTQIYHKSANVYFSLILTMTIWSFYVAETPLIEYSMWCVYIYV